MKGPLICAAALGAPLLFVFGPGLAGSLAQDGPTVHPDHVFEAPIPRGPHPAPLAVNLAELHYWCAQLAYANLFTQASQWYREDLTTWAWDSGPELELDEHGWVAELKPQQAASVLIARGPDGLLPAGTYRLLWEGEGAFQLQGDPVVVSTQPGRIEFEIATPSESGVQLRLTDTNPDDPVRDIRILPPGIAEDHVGLFHPDFLELLSGYRAIRFMDWQRTNDSELVHWNERALPSDAVQTSDAGVCLEHMIALCNALQCDAWFCMPHLATDDFVTQFATLVEDQLDPKLKVFVEYSNEVWNGGFVQAHHAAAQGAQLGLSGSEFQNQLRWYSRRSVEIFDLWSAVFDAEDQRLVRVLAGQSVNPWTGTVILDDQDAFQKADVYAIAPYFGATMGSQGEADQVLAMEEPEVWDLLEVKLDQSIEKISENVALAEEHGLPLVAYEAGQHLVGVGPYQWNDELTLLFVRMNRDDRMGELYSTYLDAWKASGAHEMFLWNLADEPSRYGSWGLLERSTQDPTDAPKYRAVREFSAQNTAWW